MKAIFKNLKFNPEVLQQPLMDAVIAREDADKAALLKATTKIVKAAK